MTRSRALALLFGASFVASGALLVPDAAAQTAPQGGPLDAPTNEADPRFSTDPRDVADPRDRDDPREVEPDPLLEPPGPKLFDALYASGQDVKLKQALGENGWSLLDYLQTQCETWLSLRERGEASTPTGQERLVEAEEKARKLALFADESLQDTRFQVYVDTVFGWSDEQQAQAREARELYRQGVAIASAARAADEAQAALTPLQQALDRARRLGDGRMQSLALVAMGNLQAAVRDEPAARLSMHEAVRIGRELRDLDSVWNALSVLYESGLRTLEWNLAEESLQEQYLIAQDAGDEDTVQRVLKQLVNLNSFRSDR